MALEQNTVRNVNQSWAITYQGLTHRTLSFHIPVDMLMSYKSQVDAGVELSHPEYNTSEFKSALTQAVNYHVSEDEEVDNTTDSLRKLNTHHRETDDRRETQLRQQIASLEEQQSEEENEGSEDSPELDTALEEERYEDEGGGVIIEDEDSELDSEDPNTYPEDEDNE